MTGLIDRMIQWFTGEDVVDSYFVQSDLKDVYITDAEKALCGEYDSKATKAMQKDDRPIGKQVK